jgi:hypothetical protein
MLTVATYTIGPAVRPPITEDNGFLDYFPRRAPTAGDRAVFAEWATLLEGAEAGQNVPFVPHNNLPDALPAYRHFLYGHGTDRIFSYDRYVNGDPSGKLTLENALLDFRRGAEALAPAAAGATTFQITGTGIACGSNDPGLASLFPYPATENWQKAIGAHFIWLSGTVSVVAATPVPSFSALFTLHAEDRYNFNPGAHDITTGIPDDANGRFEVTGLAQQYTNYAVLVRTVTWMGATPASEVVKRISDSRDRKPQDNRRLRNRT